MDSEYININFSTFPQQPLIFCIGNPLLDISTTVDNTLLHDKYELPLNTTILAQEKQLPLYKDLMTNHKCSYIPGGSAQNSVRAAQWMLNRYHPHSCVYFGCVGKDDYSSILAEEMRKEGLIGTYAVHSTEPTGVCAVLVKGTNRCLVPNLGAACHYPFEHLKDNWDLMTKSKTLYFTAYFISSNKEAALAVAKYADESNKTLCFNLAATFWINAFKNDLQEILPFCDIIISNDDEAKELAKALEFGTEDESAILEKMAKLEKTNIQKNRIVIITRGKDSTLIGTYNHNTQTYTNLEIQPLYLEPQKLVDTNGAGDAVVGGFLAAYALEKPLEECIEAGHYAAFEVIQKSGSVFPDENQQNLE